LGIEIDTGRPKNKYLYIVRLQQTIKQLLALAMLVVFAFSITPQKTIHDFVAEHADPTKCDVHIKAPIEQVEKAQLHCTFDFQVATTPFVNYNFTIDIPSQIVARAQNDTYQETQIYSSFITKESRGPPHC
jgi:predicted Co/Zn/Cd cation transporter (cation efflux family)